MASFKTVNERFRVTMVNSDGQSERVVVQIGLEGLKLLSSDGSRTMRSYDLKNISRWQSSNGSLVLYTKTPVDLEERQLTLTGDSSTIQSALDTLTCCCMQLVELLQSGRSGHDVETANNLHALVTGGGKQKSIPSLPSADAIEYWHGAEKNGWLQCQGEQLKMWRRRWFVLKQGHLFRFMSSDVSESSKPRGVVDLRQVQDVVDGRGHTGKANTILLKTASGGSVCYVCDSETDMVEWMSAIEGSIAKIVKHLAGVGEHHDAAAAAAAAAGGRSGGRSSQKHDGGGAGGSSSSSADWAKQLERNLNRASVGTGRSHGNGNGNGNGLGQYVDIVGYESAPASAPAGAHSSFGSSYDPATAAAWNAGGIAGGAGYGYGQPSGLDYSQIMGAGMAGAGAGAAAPSDTMLNYGNAYSQSSGGVSGVAYGQVPAYQQPQQQPPPLQAQPQPQQPQYQQYVQPGYGQQPQPQQPMGMSLIDQVPSAQPSYPSYYQSGQQSQQQQQVQPAGPPPPPPQQDGTWQIHYTPQGRPYYFNTALGTTQWEAPAGVVL